MTGNDHTPAIRHSPFAPTKAKSEKRKAKKPEGYSLIEMLVVLALFGMASLILVQTFLTFVRLSHKTANAAVVQQDMRFTMEYVARAVRNTPIDYSVAVEQATTTLRLKAPGQPATIIKLSALADALCLDPSGARCLLVSVDDGTTWSPITSKHVNVDRFKVYIQPTASPFKLVSNPPNPDDYPNSQQPLATIEVGLTYQALSPKENVSLDAQTTISSREYAR